MHCSHVSMASMYSGEAEYVQCSCTIYISAYVVCIRIVAYSFVPFMIMCVCVYICVMIVNCFNMFLLPYACVYVM